MAQPETETQEDNYSEHFEAEHEEQPEISTSQTDIPTSPQQHTSPISERVEPRQVKLENIMETENKNELQKKITLHKDDKEDAKQLYLDALNIVGTPEGDFDGFMSDISNQLEAVIDGENAITDPLKRYSEVLGAKRRLYDYCFDEIVRASSNFDDNLYNSLSKVKQRFGYLFDEYTETVKKMHLQYAKRIRKMQSDLDSADGEITQLLQAAEILEEEAKAHSSQQMKISEEFEKDREALMEEVGWLKLENQKLLNRLRQYELSRKKIASQIQSPNGLIHVNSKTMESDQDNSVRRGSPQRSQKSMSLRQLKDTIEEIYASKVKFDKKCKENGAPRETMEQYLYTYLNTKYGLKSLILDWASAIIHAVKRHTDSDVDVKVFSKILKNEIDEEFRLVLKKIKETVAELLKTFIKGKFPMKSDREVHNMLLSKKEGVLTEEEWVDIIKYMYNDDDTASIIMRVRQVIGANERGGESPQSKNKISYEDFINVLLDFQLRGHERFLSKFTNLFRQVDTDRNGIIDEEQFKTLVRKIDPDRSEEELDNQARQIDPLGHQSITYSDCVSFLTEDIITLIQKD